MSKEEWDEFYMGDDGTMTYYIDMVDRKFARSSTANFDKRYDFVIGNPPFFKMKSNDSLLKKYQSSAVNKETTNICSFFLDKAILFQVV